MLNEYLLDLTNPTLKEIITYLHRKKENDFKENKQKFIPIFKKLSKPIENKKVLPSVDKKDSAIVELSLYKRAH